MNIAVFCSGNGSNFQAIVNAVKSGFIKAKIAVMVCDNPSAYAITRAKKEGVDVFVLEKSNFKSREEYDKVVVSELRKRQVDLVVLAGFMRLLSPYFVSEFRNRIMNIHPALLPSFKGTHGVEDALNYGVKLTGPTVHFVDEGLDTGPIIIQEPVRIEQNDTLETLTAKIHSKEHKIYPQAIKWFVEGRLRIEGRKVFVLDGED